MPKRILFALLLMGFTSLVVQTLLIREFLISFYGNELTIGLILSNWIILEALGSSLTSRASPRAKKPHLVYALLQTAIALYLPLAIFLIRNIKNTLGLSRGEGIGVIPILFSSFFILLPLSLFDGAQFPFGCRILEDTQDKPLESAGRVYILEAIGFILAGPIFTYLLITKLNSFSIALSLGSLNLFSAILLLKDRISDTLSKTFLMIINLLFIFVVLANFSLAARMQNLSINKQWLGQRVLSYRNSIYGNLTATESKNQYTFYSDGIPIITTPLPDITGIEELVHFTMLSHPHPKNLLLLSGGAGGIIHEILKYPIERLTYTELDPQLIKLIQDFPTDLTKSELNDPRLKIEYIDARRFLYLVKSKYDCIILNLPLPSTLQLNRFYTQEFFRKVKSVLAEDGIFSFSLPGSLSYLNPQMRNLNASVLNTLKDIFYINIIPGDSNLYLASCRNFQISPEVFLKRLEENGIQTRLLNRLHLEYRLHPRWLNWFYHSLSDYTGVRKNFDLSPSATFYSIAYWNSIFSPRLQGLFRLLDKINFRGLLFYLGLSGLLLLILKRFIPQLKRASIGLAICSTGFVGMSFDLILIYAYQSFYGFVFSHLALLVTAFMAGLSLGGWLMTKGLEKVKNALLLLRKIELAMIVFCIIAGALLVYINQLPSLKFGFIFFIVSFICGYLVGSEFPLVNKIYAQDKTRIKTAGILYALDLLGAYLAALIVSVALVPVVGILKTCILLALLKIISLSLIPAKSLQQENCLRQ